jgi:hypothetical protein
MNTISDQFINSSYYLVYRKLFKSVTTPDGMLFPFFTNIIEPNDITERPLTKEQTYKYLGIGIRTLNKLIKTGMLKQYYVSGYNGHVYLRTDVRHVLKQAN